MFELSQKVQQIHSPSLPCAEHSKAPSQFPGLHSDKNTAPHPRQQALTDLENHQEADNITKSRPHQEIRRRRVATTQNGIKPRDLILTETNESSVKPLPQLPCRESRRLHIPERAPPPPPRSLSRTVLRAQVASCVKMDRKILETSGNGKKEHHSLQAHRSQADMLLGLPLPAHPPLDKVSQQDIDSSATLQMSLAELDTLNFEGLPSRSTEQSQPPLPPPRLKEHRGQHKGILPDQSKSRQATVNPASRLKYCVCVPMKDPTLFPTS